jgi:Ser/Thr protein kinase RdoA (MazF antagonist)
MPYSSTTLSKSRKGGRLAGAGRAGVQVELVERILRAYGLEWRRIGEPQQGYRNRSFPAELTDGQHLNLIFYKSEPGILDLIRNANRVSDYLAGQGLPCRQTRGPIAKLESSPRLKYAVLYTYLPGRTIPWEAYTKSHLKALGMGMSNMHAKLQGLGRGTLPGAVQTHQATVERMGSYFQEPGVRRALVAKLGLSIPSDVFDRCHRTLATCARLPGQQPLHLDFVRGNVLFQDKSDHARNLKVTISGIIDFEKTAFGHPILDITRTLAFLLVDCKYKPSAKVRKYFLHSGYAKRGTGSLPDLKLLEPLIDLFLLHDFYKFLRHNPYESLPQNEHFSRTKQLLTERGLLLQ